MSKHRKPDAPIVSVSNPNWPRNDLERVKAIIEQGDATVPAAKGALNQALFVFSDGAVADALLEMGVVPDQQIMRQAVFSLDAAGVEKLILNGGRTSPEMLADAVKLRNFAMAEVLVKYGAFPSEETQRIVKTMKRTNGKPAKALARAFNLAKRERRAASLPRVLSFLRPIV